MKTTLRTKRTLLSICSPLLPIFAAFTPSTALACGAQPYLGEICLMATNFCPRGTIEAAGQILSIAQNTALFSLYGTTYGGNGQTTFMLPDLRGRVPVGQGQGLGLSPVDLGLTWGQETVTLTQNNLPNHSHTATTTLNANTTPGTDAAPSSGKNALAGVAVQELTGSGVVASAAWGAPAGASSIAVAGISTTIASTGGNQAINIQPPSLGLRFCIATSGVFPSRD